MVISRGVVVVVSSHIVRLPVLKLLVSGRLVAMPWPTSPEEAMM